MLWQKRDEKASLERALVKFQDLHRLTPQDTEISLYLLQGHFLMGDFHLTEEAAKLRELEKAVKIGEGLLKGAALDSLDKNSVRAMFWTAVSLGVWAQTNGIMSSLKHKARIEALMKRVEALEPEFYYGSVPRFWGAYYAVLPGIMGKDLKKSQTYFKEALRLGPEFQGSKVLMAETYLVEKDDEKGFELLLKEVLADTRHDLHPELGADNRIQKIKAKRLLERRKDLF